MSDEGIDNILQFRKISSNCQHTKFIIDERMEQVECADCNLKMSPIYVLKYLANNIRLFERKKESAIQQIKIAEEKTRFKCDHCQKFTRLKPVNY